MDANDTVVGDVRKGEILRFRNDSSSHVPEKPAYMSPAEETGRVPGIKRPGLRIKTLAFHITSAVGYAPPNEQGSQQTEEYRTEAPVPHLLQDL